MSAAKNRVAGFREIGFREIAFVALVLALHWIASVTSSVEKSVTFDEVAHITGGYFQWTADDFRFNPESGILPQRLAAWPLRFHAVSAPPPNYPPRQQGNVWRVGREILFLTGNNTENMVLAARSMIALLSVVLGGVVYMVSRSLFGRLGGGLSLLLYASSPTMLAHSRLATADLAVTLFFLLSMLSLDRLLEQVSFRRLVAAGLAVGGLVLAKMSWLLLLPMAALLIGLRFFGQDIWMVRLGQWKWEIARVVRRFVVLRIVQRFIVLLLATFTVTAIVMTVVWAAHGWRFEAAGPGDVDGEFLHSWESRLAGAGVAAEPIGWAREHRVLPEAFLWGLAYTLASTGERETFLNGEYSRTGWRTFFPYAFLVKTPLPFLALLLLAAVSWWVDRGSRSSFASSSASRGTLALWVLFGVYSAAAIASPLNLGHRHLLPLYPVLFIFAGRAALRVKIELRPRAVLIAVSLMLFLVDSWRIRPHYLSYFNRFAGGPENAYHHLVDSSLDWGQDLPILADKLRAIRAREPEIPIHVAYMGAAIPSYYGIGAEGGISVHWLQSYFPAEVPHPPLPLQGGVYAISATLLQTVYTGRFGAWTAAYEEEYQARRREMVHFWKRYEVMSARPELLAERPPAEWTRLFATFNELRSVRLFHALRDRLPQDRAGYSILIYRISAGEVRQALDI